jgi:hypothetical protein
MGSSSNQVTTMFLHKHQYWLVPGNGLESDLYKLQELVSQASLNKYV